MEPVTHALTSFAVARAIHARLPRFGTALLITAGLAPDVDSASYFAGPQGYLTLHRSALHAVPGGVALGCALAAAFCMLDSRWPPAKNPRKPPPRLTFAAAAALSFLGIAAHDLLDVASGEGMQLLWPFRTHWFRWALAESFDPWVLVLLIGGLLVPQLFRLVNEEVGARKKHGVESGAAVFTLLLLCVYFGARAYFHARATDLLLSSEYHGREPLAAGALPSPANLLDWRGVVSTDNTLEELDVNLASAAELNSDRSLTHYKPPDSPALEAAEGTGVARRFLRYAEFPLASVARREDGYRVELRDLRFSAGDETAANLIVRVELSRDFRVMRQTLRYASAGE